MSTLQQWHRILESRSPEGLEDILAPDCVFYSPVVHKAQEGRELTCFYLTAAMNVFNESFAYVKELETPTHAVLEFVCDVDGIVVNGVDIMTFNEAGKITEFKVMIRPLKGVNMLHEKMRAMLEQMSA